MLVSADVFEGEGLRVLDLYAGSGALGLEALSRGAAHVTFVDDDRDAVAAIRENIRALGVEGSTRVEAKRVEKILPRGKELAGDGEGFGLVLVDPPYADVPKRQFAEVLVAVAQLLRPEGVLLLEHASPDSTPECPLLVCDRTRTYGDTAVALYRLAAQGE